MEKITRNVRDLDSTERRVYESALGHELRANQQIIVQVITLGELPDESASGATNQTAGKLPDWCDVYEGLPDEQIAEIEQTVLQRADLNRPSE